MRRGTYQLRLLVLSVVLLLSEAAWCRGANLPALRSAVPVLCTENYQAARTRVRGTAVIVASSGIMLTAAHVIQDASSNCTLTVLIPDDEWNRFRQLHAFLISDCRLLTVQDLAACRVHPAENKRDWAWLKAAMLRTRAAPAGESVWITAFTGWGRLPIVRSGQIQGRHLYQRRDGCYCDFATDIIAEEGMSGSPLISADGEVIGILTLAGRGRFRGMSFGTSLADAAAFLKKEGIPADRNREP